MKSSKNYLPKIMLIVVLIISCILIMVACDRNDCKDPDKAGTPQWGMQLTVATITSRNMGFNNYETIMYSNLLDDAGKSKLKKVQKKSKSDDYGVYIGYDQNNNAVIFIGGLYRGALYEQYEYSLPYSPRDIITKMEGAVGHTLTEDWLNASETGIDIIFIPKGGKYEVAYIARVDGQVYVITM